MPQPSTMHINTLEIGTDHEGMGLGYIFQQAGVTPAPGRTYKISVQEPLVSLGSATFIDSALP